jgi:PhzF family phenazine biosynthesis protein
MTGKQTAATLSRMTIPYYEVLAFTSRLFAGNPAGVCILNEWLPDPLLQKIAAENNLAETAFFIDRGSFFDIRWMTPTVEMDLCGHATLASAHVLFRHLSHPGDSVTFQSHSGGELRVDRRENLLVLDFPSRPHEACEAPARLAEGLRAQPSQVFKGRDYLAVFESEAEVAALAPVFDVIIELDAHGVVVTAPGDDCDFVSRYFAPRVGVPEDPVTGSVHCALIPYWAKRLGKTKLHARQLSQRGGELFCEDRGERVGIGGTAVTYVAGTLQLPNR